MATTATVRTSARSASSANCLVSIEYFARSIIILIMPSA